MYESYQYRAGSLTVQLLLLDTRQWRSDLREGSDCPRLPHSEHGPYCEMPQNSTLLGEEQWAWLADELSSAADVRIVASSIGVAAADHGWESWALFPHEQSRLSSLIASTHASGVVFISGDIHYGEVSVLKDGLAYPLYDATSSGLTHTARWPTPPLPNVKRIREPVTTDNFGLITIEREASDPLVQIELRDQYGLAGATVSLKLSELQAAPLSATTGDAAFL